MANEYLTMAEIEAKYPNEWVLLDRPKLNKCDTVLGGHLAMHSLDRDEFDKRLLGFRFDRSAVLHVYDPLSEPLFLLSPLCIEYSTDDESTSTLPAS